MTDAKVTISRETLQSALNAVDPHFRWHTAIVNLRAALAAQPAPTQPVEPVAWLISALTRIQSEIAPPLPDNAGDKL